MTEKNYSGKIVRIASKDIEGKSPISAGLTKIKGISWSISNAICNKLKMDPHKKSGDLNKEEIKKIEEFLKTPELPSFLKNRERGLEDGDDRHLTGTDLELANQFDIKRLKKIKSYRGYRHSSKLPSRGQRTKGNFRPNKMKGAGIKRKK